MKASNFEAFLLCFYNISKAWVRISEIFNPTHRELVLLANDSLSRWAEKLKAGYQNWKYTNEFQ